MNKFTDKVVVVTGAGRGLGRALALAFAKHGAIVAVNDLTPINLDETIAQIYSSGGRGRDYVFDVSKKMPVQSLFDQILADWGRVDILVNHAVVRPQVPLLDMDAWDWQRTLDVNLSGAFYCLQSAGRIMRQQGNGTIVNLVVDSSCEPARQHQSAYEASKMGLLGLTRAAVRELTGDHIRIHAVCLQGPVKEIPTGEKVKREENKGDFRDAVQKILSLCSGEADEMNDKNIHVDSQTS